MTQGIRVCGYAGIGFLASFALAVAAYAGEPVAGVEAGAAIPISGLKQLAEPGAAVAPFAGYRWGQTIGFALIAQPQFTILSSDEDVRKHDDDFTTLFSMGVGPRVSVANENAEVFLGAQGGLYVPTSGPLSAVAGGFNLSCGASFFLNEATTIGLFIRRDEAAIEVKEPSVNIQDRGNAEFLVTGVDVQHRFLTPPPAPEPVPPPAAAIAAVVVPKKKIVLRGVNFDFNKADIRTDAQPILDEASKVLAENPGVQISVEGHTDSRGSDAFNQKLSERRATSVLDYLASKGASKARLAAVGFGEAKPVASNDTAEGMAQNRRVELRITAGE